MLQGQTMVWEGNKESNAQEMVDLKEEIMEGKEG